MTMQPHPMRVWLLILTLAVGSARVQADSPSALEIVPKAGQATLGTIEIHGVEAGDFDLSLWERGTLYWLRDVRAPLLAPRRAGVFRNIYAPSAVHTPDGWRVFYGAWDGVNSGNDRIYSTFTTDFLDFGPRRMEIDHGDFIHVCNVNAIRLKDGSWKMVCTCYPYTDNTNKPGFFESPDGLAWNGAKAPYPARMSDVVDLQGWDRYPKADINGINVLLHDRGRFVLYFGDHKGPTHVHRALSEDGRHYVYAGSCLETRHFVNDVKKITVDGRASYLMGLHRNSDRLWYSLSPDGEQFGPERELAAAVDPAERYIVAHGWVVDGSKVLGFLYGAGAVPTLNRNRIFARWLQKKIVFVDQAGPRVEPSGALGPDRQILALPEGSKRKGHFEIFAEDGTTLLARTKPMEIEPGRIYHLQPSR